jgi:fatty-acid desaturase
MFKYLKHSLFHIMGLLTALFLVLGGPYLVIGLAFSIATFVLGDLFLGDDKSAPEYSYPGILTLQLWLALPLLMLIVFALMWQVAPEDLFGFGLWFENQFALNVLESRGNATWYQLVSGTLLTGFYIGMIGTITAHELVHRTRDKISLCIGRWLLAFSFDSSFSIEHVYGHHRYVSTAIDPATAPRGRNVYQHVVLSTLKGNISAWRIEKKRLMKKNTSFWSIRNKLLRGYCMSIVLLYLSYYLGGSAGLLAFIGAGVWGKTLLEVVNYMEHYGLVRDPKTPVEPRHSWNTNKRISSWAMFNLTRHSHHHAKGILPFHKLKPMSDAPEMVSGYLGTILLTFIPTVWFKVMAPKLKHWDEHFATDVELKLIKPNQ